MNNRINTLKYVFFALFSIVTLRVLQLQLMAPDKIVNRAKNQSQRRLVVNGPRGTIFDRNGEVLAQSVPAKSIYFHPHLLKADLKKNFIVDISKVLNVKKTSIKTLISKSKGKKFVWIKRLFITSDLDNLQKIKKTYYPAFSWVEEYKRVYPKYKTAASLVGFSSIDQKGLEGVEYYYNNLLTGNSILTYIGVDAKGRQILQDGHSLHRHQEKKIDLYLTIDSKLQSYSESLLENAMVTHKAKSANLIVLSLANSEILAMAQTPGFDLNNFRNHNKNIFTNINTNKVYEPGSVVKPFVVALGLESEKINQDSIIDTNSGKIKIGKYFIKDPNPKNFKKQMNLSELLTFSSNVGVVQLAKKIGFKRLEDFYSIIGMSSPVNIPISKNTNSIFSKSTNEHLNAVRSFGQGFAVSPLQLVRSYAVLATGDLVEPTILKKFTEIKGSYRNEVVGDNYYRRKIRSKILSQKTISAIQKLLVDNVNNNKGLKEVKDLPFLVSGKTGTSQIAFEEKKGYKPNIYNTSFAGFFPAFEPKYIIYVNVSEPTENGNSGSKVASPIFAEVAKFISRNSSFALNNEFSAVRSPDSIKELTGEFIKNPKINLDPEVMISVLGKSKTETAALLSLYKQKVQFHGAGNKVKKQVPESGKKLNTEKTINVYF